jgi:hypothetical protein
MHFIVVNDRGGLIAGACSSPDVAGLVALLEDEPAFVRSLADAGTCERPQASVVPRGWSVVDSDDDDVDSASANHDDRDRAEAGPDGADTRAGSAAAPALRLLADDVLA